ncbi:MAG: hypothetical protein QXL91_07540 [Candidatus Bathyarchaeia archaeon]
MSEHRVRKCPLCNVELQFAQKVPFRIKGTSGVWKLFFGELAELGEELLSFELYVCPKCGEVRFFADEKSKQSLLRLTPKQY